MLIRTGLILIHSGVKVMAAKIIITVLGGVVQTVYSSIPTEVEIVDYDNDPDQETDFEGLEQVY